MVGRVVIAEVTTPSLGVGYEVATALHLGKPTLCIYRQGTAVTRLITGNPSPHITVQSYSTEKEALRLIDGFLEAI